MELADIKQRIPEQLYNALKPGIKILRPGQAKAVNAGLLERQSLLICTPTASGKTLIAELAIMNSIIRRLGKAIYIAPLKALATEKYKMFLDRYQAYANIALSIGDLDKQESHLAEYDVIITTSEKLDSLIRHNSQWLKDVATVVIDEIHLLNDPSRGPTLEILLTILKDTLPKAQFIGLSATIGNPAELAKWLGAELIADDWRPVKLKKGIYHKGKIEFFN